MSLFASFCVAAVVVLALLGLLVRALHRLYEAEKRLARNANRDWED